MATVMHTAAVEFDLKLQQGQGTDSQNVTG